MDAFFPHLGSVTEAILVLPISNAWPEHGASFIKRIKTRLRLGLSNKMLERLLHFSVNGPDVCTEECKKIITEAAKLCLSQRNRKKRTLGSALARKRVFVSTGSSQMTQSLICWQVQQNNLPFYFLDNILKSLCSFQPCWGSSYPALFYTVQ